MRRSGSSVPTTLGFTYIELLVVAAVLVVLASAALPLARWEEKRRREGRLRVTLSMIRGALDQYNKYMREGLIPPQDVSQCALPAALETCWPLSLDELVDGVEVGDPRSPEKKRVQFLPRLPEDPITGEAKWGQRSYQDEWDSKSWGGENVYDVYSLSDRRALDGTYYSDW